MDKIIRIIAFCLIINAFGCQKKADPMRDLQTWLSHPAAERFSLDSLSFAGEPLTKEQAENVLEALFQDKQKQVLNRYSDAWDNREIVIGDYKMPFYYQVFGDKPADGRSLFISMHGGGNTSQEFNDGQYNNQKHLYDSAMQYLEGVYLAPRATTNTWNLWHEAQIDDFFNLLIQLAVIKEDVNPDKVYLMGYSAGGDGVYQLAPRMADRWAAASMMAGHPNETSPLSLKNLPFTIHVGAEDGGFQRNEIAGQWKLKLDSLESANPGSYAHEVKLHEGRAHWMYLEDSVALSWMQQYHRNPIPEEIIWKQDDRHHDRFYWLHVPVDQIQTGAEVRVAYDVESNSVNIITNETETLDIYLNDEMLNLDEAITVKYQGKEIGSKQVKRTIANLVASLSEDGDKELAFPAMIRVVNNKEIE